MAKKKKNILNQILGITENVTDIAKDFVDPEAIYNIGKDVVSTSSNVMAVNERKNKIRKLLVEIGDRIYTKQIEVDKPTKKKSLKN